MKHLTAIEQFDRAALEDLFSVAREMKDNPPRQALAGKIMATLFFEPSTRTRLSFESAMLRLGGAVIGTENAGEFSSAVKGESLEDTIKVVAGYADVIVLRHPEMGSVGRAAAVSSVPVINAGDGVGQHPTQALLDLFTITTELGGLDGRTVAFAGDLKHYRAIRSLASILPLFKDVKVIFVSLPELRMGEDVKTRLLENHIPFEETDTLDKALNEADVLYMGRMPKEYFESPEEYDRLKGKFALTKALADTMKPDSIIMHPLPRLTEIPAETDASTHARYFEEARNGLYVRMALLLDILGKNE